MSAGTEKEARLLRLVSKILDLTLEGKRGIDDVSKTLQAIKDDSNFAEKFFGKTLDFLTHIFSLHINYSRTVERGVKAGKHNQINDNITSKNFPSDMKGEKEVGVHILHFNKAMSSQDVIKEMDKMGLRPANLQELLALGESHPDLQREFPLIALGSVWQDPDGDRSYCPCLGRFDSGRDLGLSWLDRGWHERCRFVAGSK